MPLTELEKGNLSLCRYEYGPGNYCARPAVAAYGNKPVCLEHALHVASAKGLKMEAVFNGALGGNLAHPKKGNR